MEETDALCSIPGDDSDALTKGEFNRFSTQVRYYHLRPMRVELTDLKHMLTEQDRVMQAHIEAYEKFFNQMSGAKWALYALIAVLAPVAPTLYYLVKSLTAAGVL